jgi:hypothetical protein
MIPHRAKSCIVVLGNHEDRVWTKTEKYAPVLHPDSMRLMVSKATGCRCILKQGDCKNAFFQFILPEDKITIVKPHLLETQMLRRMNTGYLSTHSMAYAVAHITGIPKSMPPSTPLVCTLTRLTHASSLDTSLIPPTLTSLQPHHRSPLDFTLTTSSTSWKTPMLNASLNNSSFLWLRSTSWVLLNGSLALIFNGVIQKTRYQYISAKQDLQHTLLRTTTLTFAVSRRMPLRTVPVFLLMLSQNQTMMRIVQRLWTANENIKVWWALLGG